MKLQTTIVIKLPIHESMELEMSTNPELILMAHEECKNIMIKGLIDSTGIKQEDIHISVSSSFI